MAGGKISDWKASDWTRSQYTPSIAVVHYLSWNSEGDRFDDRRANLVCSHDLTVTDIDCALGEEAHTALRITALVLRKEVQLIIFVFIVTNVAITTATD